MIEKHLNILRHSLGYDDEGGGREYRNYYAADPGNEDCSALVASGDMQRTHGLPPGLIYYRVTEQGRKCVLAERPNPKKASRSEKRVLS